MIRNYKLIHHSLATIGSDFRILTLTMVDGTKKSDLEQSEEWDILAARLQQGDEIRVIDSSFTKMARCICTFSDGTQTSVKVISWHVLGDGDIKQSASVRNQYEIRRETKGWVVIRLSDKMKIKEGLKSESVAVRAAEDDAKASRK